MYILFYLFVVVLWVGKVLEKKKFICSISLQFKLLHGIVLVNYRMWYLIKRAQEIQLKGFYHVCL